MQSQFHNVEWARPNGYRQEAAGEDGHHPSAYNRRCTALLQLAKYSIREHRCATIVEVTAGLIFLS